MKTLMTTTLVLAALVMFSNTRTEAAHYYIYDTPGYVTYGPGYGYGYHPGYYYHGGLVPNLLHGLFGY